MLEQLLGSFTLDDPVSKPVQRFGRRESHQGLGQLFAHRRHILRLDLPEHQIAFAFFQTVNPTFLNTLNTTLSTVVNGSFFDVLCQHPQIILLLPSDLAADH